MGKQSVSPKKIAARCTKSFGFLPVALIFVPVCHSTVGTAYSEVQKSVLTLVDIHAFKSKNVRILVLIVVIFISETLLSPPGYRECYVTKCVLLDVLYQTIDVESFTRNLITTSYHVFVHVQDTTETICTFEMTAGCTLVRAGYPGTDSSESVGCRCCYKHHY